MLHSLFYSVQYPKLEIIGIGRNLCGAPIQNDEYARLLFGHMCKLEIQEVRQNRWTIFEYGLLIESSFAI